MDGYQDSSALAVLVLTPDYLASDYCIHEMERALQHNQPIVPIVRGHNALYKLLRRESTLPGKWEYLERSKRVDVQPLPEDEADETVALLFAAA
jgi:hypothetical protein